MKHTWNNKVIIITGGTSGIGRELTEQLCSAGAVVIFCARNPETGKSIEQHLKADGCKASFRSVDVQDADAVEELINDVMKLHGRLDYIFNCAGIIMGGEIRDQRMEDIDNLLNTNVHGTVHAAYYAYRVMAEQGHGHIVNFSSAAGIMPVPLLGIYGASKFAIFGLSESMRIEGKALGVRVSVATPGLVDTPIYDTGIYSKTDKGKALEQLRNNYAMISAHEAAERILSGVMTNQAVIQTHGYARLGWLQYKLKPWAYRWSAEKAMVAFREKLRTK